MANKGIIFKAQKELYYVLFEEKIYKCKARGVFRERNIKPLVGDWVDIKILDNNEGFIEYVYERKSKLDRPPVANIDQIILVLTLKSPNINYNLVDKYLVMLEHYDLPVVIVVNKIDLISKEDINEFTQIYEQSGYSVIFTSAKDEVGIEELKNTLKNKITSLAGPSGVGKSTLLNLLHEDIEVETGSISDKTKRGKHTTRHTELFELMPNSYLLDTPGFSSLDLSFIEDETNVRLFYPEFRKIQNQCKFQNCQHLKEPKCKVKDLLEKGLIATKRYENYQLIRDEIKNNRRY